jgi:uncharacterized protein
MARRPEAFVDFRCMVGVEPLSPRFYLEKNLVTASLPLERMEIKLITSFDLQRLSLLEAAKAVTIPALVYQVRTMTFRLRRASLRRNFFCRYSADLDS